MNKEPKQQEFSNDQIARRKLLGMVAYAPPAILGVMMASSNEASADSLGQSKKCKGGGSIIVSAGGNACCPCVPGDPKYNPDKCNKERCEFGNCASCKLLVFNKKSDCNKMVNKSGCPCSCVKTGGFWVMTGC